MRIVGLMTFVCLLLLLAMVPAFLQMARIGGVQTPTALSIAIALVIVAGMFCRRE